MGIVTKYVSKHIPEKKIKIYHLFCTPQTLGQQLQTLAFFDKESVVGDMVKCFFFMIFQTKIYFPLKETHLKLPILQALTFYTIFIYKNARELSWLFVRGAL